MMEECEILMFPVRSRVGKIRHVASKLADGRTRPQQAAFWKLTTKTMAECLEKQGFSGREIVQAISALRDSVQDELNRMAAEQPKIHESK